MPPVTIEILPKFKKRKTRAKGTGRKQLIKKADRLHSMVTRRRYADKNGIVTCYTCPYQAHWKKMQNGHYITRSIYYTRWHEDNMRPQCFVCNMRRQGMSHAFRENLVKEIGEARVVAMEDKARELYQGGDEFIHNALLAAVDNPLAGENSEV